MKKVILIKDILNLLNNNHTLIEEVDSQTNYYNFITDKYFVPGSYAPIYDGLSNSGTLLAERKIVTDNRFFTQTEYYDNKADKIAVYNADGTVNLEQADCGFRLRGNTTQTFPKKPFAIKLAKKANILDIMPDGGKHKRWCLLANYADRTLMRNILAMKLSEVCGFAWTPHMYSVHVYLNNEYQGVYTFCEHKKVSKDRVDIDLDAGDVYLEIEQQQDETTCWWTSMGVPMMFSDPEEPSAELLAEIQKHFDDFEDALYSKDMADPVKGYAAYIDVDSFIDYYIVQELAKNTDGNLRKSSFITKKKGGKLVMHHLWDFDLTFGNSGGLLHDPEGFFIKDYTPGWYVGDNWFNRMMKDPAFVDRLQARWNELYPQLVAMVDFIDEQALILDKAQQQNFKVWSIWESVDWVDCPSLGSYEKEVAFLKEFYSKRVEWMNTEINKL